MHTRPTRKKKRSDFSTPGDRRGHPERFEKSVFVRPRGRYHKRPSKKNCADPELALGGGWMRAGHVARLTAEEERALAERVKAGDADAQNQLIVANLPFVFRAVRAYRKSGLPLDDLVQEGSLGLTRAARTFDPAIHSASFATYARYWIRYYLARAVINSDSVIPISQHVMRLRLRYRRALRELRAVRPAGEGDAGSKTFSLSEIAGHMGVSMRQLKNAMLAGAHSSASLNDIPVEDHVRPDDVISGEEQRAAIQAAMERLHPFESWLLSRRYGLQMLKPFPWERRRTRGSLPQSPASDGESASASGLESSGSVRPSEAKFHQSFEEIAAECGLSHHRIRCIHRKALRKLRTTLVPHFRDDV
jgi:RNA polymerase nonessential primary-like sigma factor